MLASLLSKSVGINSRGVAHLLHPKLVVVEGLQLPIDEPEKTRGRRSAVTQKYAIETTASQLVEFRELLT